MKLIRNTLAASLLAAVSVVACSTQNGAPGTSTGTGSGQTGTLPGTAANTGSIGMHLQIATGVVLQGLNWTISGTGLPTYTGNVPIGDAQSIEFEQGGIQQGGPYTITLTGTDSQNDPCTGSATFSITAGATSFAVVSIVCTQPADASTFADVTTGTLAIDAGVTVVTAAAYNCPGISGVSINPAEIIAPQTAGLDVTTVVTPGGTPGTATITWTTTAGTFVDTGSTTSSLPAPTFNCGAFTGTATVTVTIGLTGSNNGVDAGDVCASAPFQTQSGQIVCEVGGQLICSNPTPNTCGTGSGAFCTNLQTNSSTCGSCTNVCPAAETCVSGACACPTATPTFCSASDTCVNTQTNAANCGSCGNACAAGDSCVAGACVLPPGTACTTSPCAANGANSVQCSGSTGGVCTATEAAIVKVDIAAGHTLASGQLNSATSCYACLVSNGGLDDTSGDSGNECGDVPSTAATLTGENPVQACLDTLNCIIAQSCDTANPPALCFCGTAAGSACLNAGAANGACLQNEINGLDIGTGTTLGSLVEGNPTATNEAYTKKSLASGMANALGGFAVSNCATQCGANL